MCVWGGGVNQHPCRYKATVLSTKLGCHQKSSKFKCIIIGFVCVCMAMYILQLTITFITLCSHSMIKICWFDVVETSFQSPLVLSQYQIFSRWSLLCPTRQSLKFVQINSYILYYRALILTCPHTHCEVFLLSMNLIEWFGLVLSHCCSVLALPVPVPPSSCFLKLRGGWSWTVHHHLQELTLHGLQQPGRGRGNASAAWMAIGWS